MEIFCQNSLRVALFAPLGEENWLKFFPDLIFFI